MLANEKKEKIRKKAEKLSQMDVMQLLMVKTFQDGIIAGQELEREKINRELQEA